MLRPLRREKAATQKPKDNWLRTEREERLWQALRHWRQQRAHAEEVPAYVVCGDKTLRDIVEKMPQTLEDLHQIYGLGEAKINKFGIDILNVCENAAENQSGQTSNEEPLFTPKPSANSNYSKSWKLGVPSRQPPNNAPWAKSFPTSA